MRDTRARNDAALPPESPDPKRQFGVFGSPEDETFVEAADDVEHVAAKREEAAADERDGRGFARSPRQPLHRQVSAAPREAVAVAVAALEMADSRRDFAARAVRQLGEQGIEPTRIRVDVRVAEDDHVSRAGAGAEIARA